MVWYLNQQSADVLIVASDIDDVIRIRQTLQQARLKNRLHHVGDALEASAYLRREEPYSQAPRPNLVLIDASLSRSCVLDLVAELQADRDLEEIPIILLTTLDSKLQLITLFGKADDGAVGQPLSPDELVRVLTPNESLFSLPA